jgi:hypothetical protein
MCKKNKNILIYESLLSCWMNTKGSRLMPDSLRHRLSESLSAASKADRAIASYMLAEMTTVPFETAASLATKVGVSEPTVGRFCRTLGYKSFRDLKDHLQHDIGDRPWLIADRLGVSPASLLTGLPSPSGDGVTDAPEGEDDEQARLLNAFVRIADPRRRQTLIDVAEGLGAAPLRRRADPA